MKVIYEDDDVLLVLKPRFLPTASLARKNDQDTLVKQVLNYFPCLSNVEGRNKDEYGLLHRLDNDTEGLVLWAKRQSSYDFLLEEQKCDRISKNYIAYCTLDKANLTPQIYSLNEWQNLLTHSQDINIRFSCKFIKALAKSSKVRAVSIDSNSMKATKVYNTDFKITYSNNGFYKVEASLTNGFRHQVRSSLLALGLPIIGDKIYNPTSVDNFSFWAYKINFIHPTTKQSKEFSYQFN